MSKKSRRRNKKILSALLLGGLGLAAANRGKGTGVSGSDKAKFTSDPAYKMDDNSFKVQDVAVETPILKKVPFGKMRGVGSDADAIAAQEKRANYAKNARINAINTAEGSPIIDNPYIAPIKPRGGRLVNRNLTSFKKGGRVKGAGCAKRGFGKAFKGGKK